MLLAGCAGPPRAANIVKEPHALSLVSQRTQDKEDIMRGILLWAIGIPIPVIILLYLFVF